jgi:hypothetical protein
VPQADSGAWGEELGLVSKVAAKMGWMSVSLNEKYRQGALLHHAKRYTAILLLCGQLKEARRREDPNPGPGLGREHGLRRTPSSRDSGLVEEPLRGTPAAVSAS